MSAKNAKKLHVAIHNGDANAVETLLNHGSVHCRLHLQADDLADAQKSISPTLEQTAEEIAAIETEAAPAGGVITYDGFLKTVGLHDKKEELGDYLDGDTDAEKLEALKAMDEDD